MLVGAGPVAASPASPGRRPLGRGYRTMRGGRLAAGRRRATRAGHRGFSSLPAADTWSRTAKPCHAALRVARPDSRLSRSDGTTVAPS